MKMDAAALIKRQSDQRNRAAQSGLFGGDAGKTHQYATMPQSAKRKKLGIYYTPPELTSRIVQFAVGELIAERFAAAVLD